MTQCFEHPSQVMLHTAMVFFLLAARVRVLCICLQVESLGLIVC